MLCIRVLLKIEIGQKKNLQTTPQIKENKIFDSLRYEATAFQIKAVDYIVDQKHLNPLQEDFGELRLRL